MELRAMMMAQFLQGPIVHAGQALRALDVKQVLK